MVERIVEPMELGLLEVCWLVCWMSAGCFCGCLWMPVDACGCLPDAWRSCLVDVRPPTRPTAGALHSPEEQRAGAACCMSAVVAA